MSFVVINNVGMRQDKFIQTQEQKATVQNVLTAYTTEISGVLDTYKVRYGNSAEMAFRDFWKSTAVRQNVLQFRITKMAGMARTPARCKVYTC